MAVEFKNMVALWALSTMRVKTLHLRGLIKKLKFYRRPFLIFMPLEVFVNVSR